MEIFKKSNNKKCNICGIDATSLCLECTNYYCDACFKYVHDKEINNQHKKEKIDYFVPIDTRCPEHPKNLLNLFCIDEKGKYFYYYYFFYRTLLYSMPF